MSKDIAVRCAATVGSLDSLIENYQQDALHVLISSDELHVYQHITPILDIVQHEDEPVYLLEQIARDRS